MNLLFRAANTPSGEDGFKAALSEIQQIKENIVDLANTQYDGNIFLPVQMLPQNLLNSEMTVLLLITEPLKTTLQVMREE